MNFDWIDVQIRIVIWFVDSEFLAFTVCKQNDFKYFFCFVIIKSCKVNLND